jgi:hypothetical protein
MQNKEFKNKATSSDSQPLKAKVIEMRIDEEKDKRYLWLNIPIEFTYQNLSSENILIIPKAVKILGIKIAKTKEEARNRQFIFDREGYPSFKNRELLGIKNPDEPEVIALTPNNMWKWTENLEIAFNKSREKDTVEYLLKSIGCEKQNLLYFQVEVSFFPMNTMREEGNFLKSDWKNSGNLLLDAITIEPIPVCSKQLSCK